MEYQLVLCLLVEIKGLCFPDDVSAALSELYCPEFKFLHNGAADNTVGSQYLNY